MWMPSIHFDGKAGLLAEMLRGSASARKRQ
jgi:hypothetical protein